MEIALLMVPLGESSPPPNEPGRQILYGISDVCFVQRPIQSTVSVVMEVLSSARQFQIPWWTSHEAHLNTTWTQITSARYTPTNPIAIQFQNTSAELFSPIPDVPSNTETIRLLPCFPTVPCIPLQELQRRHPFATPNQPSPMPSSKLQAFRVQVIWRDSFFNPPLETMYSASLSDMLSLTPIVDTTLIGTNPVTMSIGPIPETQTSSIHAFPLYWLRLRLVQSQLNQPDQPLFIANPSIWAFQNDEDYMNYKIVPRSPVYSSPTASTTSTKLTFPKQMSDPLSLVFQMDQISQLNRQRDISERIFWSSLTTRSSLNPDPHFIVPQLFPSVPRPIQPFDQVEIGTAEGKNEDLETALGWYSVTLCRLLIRVFLLRFTSDAIPPLQTARLGQLSESIAEPEIVSTGLTTQLSLSPLEPYWIQPMNVLSPNTIFSHSVLHIDISESVSIPTSSLRTYVQAQALLFLAHDQGMPFDSRIEQKFLSIVIPLIDPKTLNLDSLHEIFLQGVQDTRAAAISSTATTTGQSRIPRKPLFGTMSSLLLQSAESTRSTLSKLDFYKLWYRMATYIPFLETDVDQNLWLTLPYSITTNEFKFVRHVPALQLRTPPLLLLMRYAMRTLETAVVNSSVPDTSNVVTLIQDRDEFNWFNSITYLTENNLYWEAQNMYNLILQEAETISI